MKNVNLAHKVIQEIVNSGVVEFCLCAGARNAPFINLFDENRNLKAYHFFEERAAAFFALGRIAITRKPVAVITTSGTAAAELLPAAIEGTYSSLPIILITADRPRYYRKTGAPQSINQVGIFSYYIEVAYDLDEENTHFSLKSLSWKKPIHVNVCFREPLIDGEAGKIDVPENPVRTKFPEAIPRSIIDDLEEFLAKNKPLVLISTLPQKYRSVVLSFLKNLKAPIYAEGISNLRGSPELSDYLIQGGDKSLNRILDSRDCDSILKLGGAPTLRLWRDLEDKRKELKVFSIGYNHFPGLARHVTHYSDLEVLSQVSFSEKTIDFRNNKKMDSDTFEKINNLFLKYPSAEPSLFYFLSKQTHNQAVFLGNSLPVREWDFAADPSFRPLKMAASRGANGIDGQLSTFLGWCSSETTNWGIFGDLTTLYDLSSLWITPQIESKKIRIVIVNNGGGQIFQRIFKKPIFLNEHQINFEHWAKMWKFEYLKLSVLPERLDCAEYQVIELVPDLKQTQAFWDEYDQSPFAE